MKILHHKNTIIVLGKLIILVLFFSLATVFNGPATGTAQAQKKQINNSNKKTMSPSGSVRKMQPKNNKTMIKTTKKKKTTGKKIGIGKKPDLVLKKLTVNQSQVVTGQSIVLKIQIHNPSDILIDRAGIRLNLNQRPVFPDEYRRVPAKSRVLIHKNVRLNKSGRFNLGVTLDPDNKINETNERNNQGQLAVNVMKKGKAIKGRSSSHSKTLLTSPNQLSGTKKNRKPKTKNRVTPGKVITKKQGKSGESGKIPPRLFAGGNMDQDALEHDPDLVVTSLEVVSDEVRFKVRNVGKGEKKAMDRVNYELFIQAAGSWIGLAAITTLARLRPGEETAENRITADFRYDLRADLRLCINPDRRIAESNYENNCMFKKTDQLLSDLQPVSAQFIVHKKPKKKGFFKTIWDTVTGGFDTSGRPVDYIDLAVTNHGEETVIFKFPLRIEILHERTVVKSYNKVFDKYLKPGVTRNQKFYVGRGAERWSNYTKYRARIIVDSSNNVFETNESNNRLTVSAQRVGTN